MKTRHVLALLLCILLLFANGALQSQQQENPDACKFTIQESTAKPAVTGTDEVVSRVHVIEQPDSPLEILSVDFKNAALSVYDEKFRWDCRSTMKIRNRSDRTIQGFDVLVGVRDSLGAGVGGGRRISTGLAPGQEVEFKSCGDSGSGGAPNGIVRVLVGVRWVVVEGCEYHVSARIPQSSGVQLRPFHF